MGNRISELSGGIIVRRTIAASAADGETWARTILEAPNDLTVTRVTWIPDAAVTGADTNNFALAARNEGTDGTGATAVTSTKTYASGTDSVGNVPEDLTLSATAADLDLSAGEVLSLVRSANGTGLASPSGIVEIEYEND